MAKVPVQEEDGARLIGYARVSTREQNLDLQIAALKAAGVRDENLHVEHVSSVRSDRPKLRQALKDLRGGDTFIVWRLDRLGRKVEELFRRIRKLEEAGVAFRSLTETFDTKTAAGKLFFGMLAVMAEFERNVTIERTKAGMAEARNRGRRPGVPPKIHAGNRKEVEAMLRTMTVAEVAKRVKCAPATIYKYWDSEALEKLKAGKR